MNKKRPNEIRKGFENEADSFINFYTTAASGLIGQAHEDKNLTILSELIFLNTYVAFETFISDIFMAYINKSSMSYQNFQEAKIKKLVKEEYGDWYSNRISMSKSLHLKADEVESLIDPKGFNLTFSSTNEMKRIAGGWIAQEHREKIFRLTDDDLKFIDCCREIRNAIAHKSKRSLTSMNDLLRSIPDASTISFIHRQTNDINVVGVFLKSRSNGEQRVIKCIHMLKDISSRM